jgi:hypothetical protein
MNWVKTSLYKESKLQSIREAIKVALQKLYDLRLSLEDIEAAADKEKYDLQMPSNHNEALDQLETQLDNYFDEILAAIKEEKGVGKPIK